MLNSKKLKIACIGAGGFTSSVHLPSLKSCNDVNVTAICDMNNIQLKKTADQFNIRNRYADYREMLEKEKPDAVYVIVAPHRLFDIAVDCLEKKMNIFTEKPPGITAEQTRRMALLATKNNCITMVGFHRRHIPLLRTLRDKIEQRGAITQCVASYFKNLPGKHPYYRGAIDLLTCDIIHAVDTLRWLMGDPVSVTSSVRMIAADYNNSFNAMMTFPSGAIGFIMSNFLSGRRFFTVEMHGKGISAFVDPDEKGVLYKDDNNAGEFFSPAQAAGSDERLKYLGFYHETRHFIECLKKRKQPISCLNNAVGTMELVDRIYHSRIDKNA